MFYLASRWASCYHELSGDCGAGGNPSGAWQPATQCSDPGVSGLVIGVVFGQQAAWTKTQHTGGKLHFQTESE